MDTALDHLVVAGTDLSALVAWWQLKTGNAPEPGGSHTGMATRNALVGLGGSSYVELIGPDPSQPEPATPRPFGIDEMEANSFRLVTLALSVTDLVSATDVVRHNGLDPGEIRGMNRLRPDGKNLSWQLAVPPDRAMGGVLPFLIRWDPGTPHPAASLGGSTRLRELRLQHPQALSIQGVLTGLGSDLVVTEGPSPSISASLDTPGGELLL